MNAAIFFFFFVKIVFGRSYTDTHNKMTNFYLCVHKILFVAQTYPPRGGFICATNSSEQIHRRQIIAVFNARSWPNLINV
jgi:hypothetical protein